MVGLEPEWPGGALVGYASIPIDHINPVRPGRIGHFRCVLNGIDQGGKFDAQIGRAGAGQVDALVITLRRFIDDILSFVDRQLPGVASVGFLDVNQIELDLVAVLTIELVKGGNLPPKRRSGIAAKYQHHRFLPAPGR